MARPAQKRGQIHRLPGEKTAEIRSFTRISGKQTADIGIFTMASENICRHIHNYTDFGYIATEITKFARISEK